MALGSIGYKYTNRNACSPHISNTSIAMTMELVPDSAIYNYIDDCLGKDPEYQPVILEELQPAPYGYNEAPSQSTEFAYDCAPIMVATALNSYDNSTPTVNYEYTPLVQQYEYYYEYYDTSSTSPATTTSKSSYSNLPSPTPSFDSYQVPSTSSSARSSPELSSPSSSTSSSASSSPFNSPPASPRRGRGRPRQSKIESGSEKVRKFRLEKQKLDEQVQNFGWNAIYHGICQEVTVSEDYNLAVKKIAESKNWKQSFVSRIRYCQSMAPTRGRKRSDCKENKKQSSREYTRRYNAQRKPGVFFLLLKDVLCQLKQQSPQIYNMVIADIKRDCRNLFVHLTSDNGKGR